ncbi:unnamed protein product [Absidia cylindrospora]
MDTTLNNISLRDLLPKDMSNFRSYKVAPISPVDSLNNSLTKNTALHRLIVQHPIQSHLQLEKWYRVNVDIVTEMGILLTPHKLEEEFQHGIRLTCSMYHHNANRQNDEAQLMVEVEPLMKDIWDADTAAIAPWPGFAPKSCHGGFKYRLSTTTISPQPSVPVVLPCEPCYLMIQSTSHADSILPIVLGPVHFDQSFPTPLNHPWEKSFQADSTCCKCAMIDHREDPVNHINIHRKMTVKDGCHLLIKERWNCGTPGKLWDSALLMTSLFANAIYKHPDRFANHRILDLSAG